MLRVILLSPTAESTGQVGSVSQDPGPPLNGGNPKRGGNVMLSSQGPDPNLIPLLIALAILCIIWWRVVLIIIGVALIVVLGLGAMDVVRDMYHAVGR
jgi:hypothetical protein